MHSMRFTKAKWGSIIIKLDLDKAYNCIKWSFIKSTLRDAALPSELVSVIIRMVTTGSSRLICNGEKTDVTRPTRGLRQGDPTSSYLFILCIEKLGQWLRKKVEEGKLREEMASRGGLGLSHLFFVDDLLLFSESCEE